MLNKEFVQEIAAMQSRAAQPFVVDGLSRIVVNGQVLTVTPGEHTNFAVRPVRVTQAVEVRDAASFLAYWGLYSDANSRAFADRDHNKIVAILDYHEAANEATEQYARWCKHQVTLQLRYTEEWETWTKKNGEQMSQADFAEFIEDNGPDIIEPKAAAMYEMASNLQAKRDVQFAQAVQLSNGQTQFAYREEINGTWGSDKLQVPTAFKILIPVYEGQKPVEIIARLRYRINGGKLAMWYQLLHVDRQEREAFESIVQTLRGDGRSVFIGKP